MGVFVQKEIKLVIRESSCPVVHHFIRVNTFRSLVIEVVQGTNLGFLEVIKNTRGPLRSAVKPLHI